MGFFQDYRLNSFSLGRSRQLNTIPGQFRGIGGTRMMGSTYINFNNYNMGGTRGFYGYDYGCQEKGGFWNTFANWTMGAGILGNMFGGIFQSIGLAGGADGKGGVDKTKEKKTTTTPDFPNEAQKAVLEKKGWKVEDKKDGSYTITKDNDVLELTPELYKKLVSSDLDIPEVKAQKKTGEKPEATDNTELINNALGDSKTIKNSFSDRENNSSIGDKNAFIDNNDIQYSEIPTKISVTDNNKGTFEFEKTTEIITVNGKKYPVYELKNHTGGYGGINSGCKYALINGELVQPAESEYLPGESHLTGTGKPAWSSKLSGGGGSTDVKTSTSTKTVTKKPGTTPVTTGFPEVTPEIVAGNLTVKYNGKQVSLQRANIGEGYTGIIDGKKYLFDEDGKITNLISEYVGNYKNIKVEKIYDNKTKGQQVHYKSSTGSEWVATYAEGTTPGGGIPIKIKIGEDDERIVKDDHISKDNKYFKVDKYGTRISGPKIKITTATARNMYMDLKNTQS